LKGAPTRILWQWQKPVERTAATARPSFVLPIVDHATKYRCILVTMMQRRHRVLARQRSYQRTCAGSAPSNVCLMSAYFQNDEDEKQPKSGARFKKMYSIMF
jgi:hypothetical protein